MRWEHLLASTRALEPTHSEPPATGILDEEPDDTNTIDFGDAMACETVVGDSLLAAAYLTYLGPLPAKLRALRISHWAGVLHSLGIACTFAPLVHQRRAFLADTSCNVNVERGTNVSGIGAGIDNDSGRGLPTMGSRSPSRKRLNLGGESHGENVDSSKIMANDAGAISGGLRFFSLVQAMTLPAITGSHIPQFALRGGEYLSGQARARSELGPVASGGIGGVLRRRRNRRLSENDNQSAGRGLLGLSTIGGSDEMRLANTMKFGVALRVANARKRFKGSLRSVTLGRGGSDGSPKRSGTLRRIGRRPTRSGSARSLGSNSSPETSPSQCGVLLPFDAFFWWLVIAFKLSFARLSLIILCAYGYTSISRT